MSKKAPETKEEALHRIMILEARLCLYGWATIGRGLPRESFKKVLRNVIPEWNEMDEIKLSYPDGMTAQECHFQVDAVFKDQNIVDEDFIKYIRRCYSQDDCWWLFGFFPKPIRGRSKDVKARENLEEAVGRVLWGQSPNRIFEESAA